MEQTNLYSICTNCRNSFAHRITESEWNTYINSGALIQVFFPHLSDTERESVIMGMCGKCVDEMYAEFEELSDD